MKKLAVLISGRGSNMRSILEAIAAGRIAAQCAAVISDRADAPGLKIAKNFGAPCHVIDAGALRAPQTFDMALLDILEKKIGAEVVALAGFMRILGAELVDRYHGRMLNIHPSLLPKYKGLNTHQRALDDRQSEHGCSAHFVDKNVDGGAIVMQARIAVDKNDTASTLAERVLHYEHIVYPQSLALLCSERLALRGRQCLLDGDPLLEPLRPRAGAI